jgi:hypothetical protein
MTTRSITRSLITALAGAGLLIAGSAYAQSTFTTDNDPPVISDITTASTTQTSTRVLWDTDEPATSQVEYGVNTFYGASTTLATSTVTSHEQELSGLTPGTVYHFRVHSKDAAGNHAVSADQTFTTLGTSTGTSTDTTGPIISDIESDPEETTAEITWKTNEAATSQVLYGTTTSYGASTTIDNDLVNNHEVNLSGLTASTTYHFQVLSKDAAGNLSTSSDQMFVTSGEDDDDNGTTTPPDDEAIEELIDALEGLKNTLMNMINFLDDKIDQLLDAIGEDDNGNGNGNENGEASISPSSPEIREGTNVDFTGRNFGIEEDVEVKRGSTVVRISHADNEGNFSTGSITVAGDAGDTETYTFRGLESGKTVTATIEIIP